MIYHCLSTELLMINGEELQGYKMELVLQLMHLILRANLSLLSCTSPVNLLPDCCSGAQHSAVSKDIQRDNSRLSGASFVT